MKNILYTIILSLLFSFSVFADFEVGMDAYEQGDYAIALKEFKNLAKQGDAAGQVGLGSMYHAGKGVTQDYKEAAKWFDSLLTRAMLGHNIILVICIKRV